jgi:hypothetical protein
MANARPEWLRMRRGRGKGGTAVLTEGERFDVP